LGRHVRFLSICCADCRASAKCSSLRRYSSASRSFAVEFKGATSSSCFNSWLHLQAARPEEILHTETELRVLLGTRKPLKQRVFRHHQVAEPPSPKQPGQPSETSLCDPQEFRRGETGNGARTLAEPVHFASTPMDFAVTLPFLLRAQHRFVVRGAHDNPVFIGKFCVQRIIFFGGIVPHSGPEVIRFQAEKKFEYLAVEFVIVVSELFLYPAVKRRRLIFQISCEGGNHRPSRCIRQTFLGISCEDAMTQEGNAT
jgi:hypothetical protein